MRALCEFDRLITFYDPANQSRLFQYERSWGNSNFNIRLDTNNPTQLKLLTFKLATIIDLQKDTIEGQTLIGLSDSNDHVSIKMRLQYKTRAYNIESEIIFNESFFTTAAIIDLINQIRATIQEALKVFEKKLQAGIPLSEAAKTTRLYFELQPTDTFISKFQLPGKRASNPYYERWILEDEILDRIKRNPWIDLNEDEYWDS